MVKLVVGVDSLEMFYRLQQHHRVPYKDGYAVPCWTRTRPKQAEEILASGGSIYRVIRNRIMCRHRILGFETVETQEKGTMCMIMQSPEMIRTLQTPKRPFQGWRYLKESDAPEDIGIYQGDALTDDDDAQLQAELKAAGLL